jgi:hypothetical protein
MRPIILRAQSDILAEIKEEINPTGVGNLWTDRQIYRAMNRALRDWAGRVMFPRLYTFPDGFSSGVYGYSLPSYIRGPIQVRQRSTIFGYRTGVQITDDFSTWIDIPHGSMDPTNTTGDSEFRFHSYPYSEDGQILWWMENGPVPVTTALPTLDDDIDSDDTSLGYNTPNPSYPIPENGWVKVGEEFIAYSGVTRTDTLISLLNLGRGVLATSATTHTGGDDIEWCIAADSERLWEQLIMNTIAILHMSPLHRGTAEDRANHEKMTNYAKGIADGFWRMSGYVPARGPKVVLDQRAMGSRPWY